MTSQRWCLTTQWLKIEVGVDEQAISNEVATPQEARDMPLADKAGAPVGSSNNPSGNNQ